MLVTTGFFNSRNSPCLGVHLAGLLTHSKDSPGIEFEAVIDTGFAGYVSMPTAQALPLGLALSGQVDVVLADGSVGDKLTAMGHATVADRTRWVEVILQSNCDELLIGLKFLQVFDLALVMTSNEILLLEEDEAWLDMLRDPVAIHGTREPPPPPYLSPGSTFRPSPNPVRTGCLGVSITGRSGQHKTEPR